MKTQLGNVSNDAESTVLTEAPYAVEVEFTGSAPILFHRWSVDGVAAKAAAKKGSKAKKEDDIESYVYRNEIGELAIPGEYFRMSTILAAKYKQDPRSPRKSAMDLFKAGIVTLTDLGSLGIKDWDYLDRRRVTIQRNGITRTRPAINKGWKTSITFQVLTPEYISPELFNETLQSAGRLVGVGDFRPTFGRFQVTKFQILK
jgi:hypothetical protein